MVGWSIISVQNKLDTDTEKQRRKFKITAGKSTIWSVNNQLTNVVKGFHEIPRGGKGGSKYPTSVFSETTTGHQWFPRMKEVSLVIILCN